MFLNYGEDLGFIVMRGGGETGALVGAIGTVLRVTSRFGETTGWLYIPVKCVNEIQKWLMTNAMRQERNARGVRVTSAVT